MNLDALLLNQLAGKLSVATLQVAGVIGIIRFRRLPSGLRYLVGLIWFGLAIELAAIVLQSRHQPNLFLGPLDAASELWLLSLVYSWALQSPLFRQLRPWLAGGFVLYAGFNSLLSPELARFKPAVQVIESLLVLGMVGMYFRKLLNELRVQRLARDPMFWVSNGLLMYTLGKLQIALFSNYMLQHYSQQMSLKVWAFHALLTVVLYGCYCRALWIRPQN